MIRIREIVAVFCVLSAGACASASSQPDAPAPSGSTASAEPDGAAEQSSGPTYSPGATESEVLPMSSAQAERGEFAFLASCTGCHASSEFTDATFRDRWSNRSAADLYEILRTTMPEDMPSSLPPARYVEIVAYLLQLNGFEAEDGGTEWDVDALARVTLDRFSRR